jgi:hypothetical protein
VVAVIECAGAPRDLGLDQGRACRDRLRARFAERSWIERWRLRAGRGAPDPLRRDLRRHLPHQAESLAGLAAGARVPAAWLEGQLEAEFGDAFGDQPALLALGGDGGRLGRGLAGDWILRRSRPEGLFASVEVTRPWLTTALVGVNERGLAAAAVGGLGSREPCAAPAALLVQDCLERFETVESALEWCLGRPGGGHAAILLADAGGDAGGVEASGAERRVLRPAEGILVSGGWAARDAELAKALREAAPLEAFALARRLPGGGVAIDPGGRCLVVEGLPFSP